jgi:hypothetical protein
MTDENSLGGGYAGRKLSFSINLSVGAILNLSCKSTAHFPRFYSFRDANDYINEEKRDHKSHALQTYLVQRFCLIDGNRRSKFSSHFLSSNMMADVVDFDILL